MHQVACKGFKFQGKRWSPATDAAHTNTAQLQTQHAKCFQLSGSSCSRASRRMSDVSQPILILMQRHTACNSLSLCYVRQWPYQRYYNAIKISGGLLVISSVMRVQFQSVEGGFLYCQIAFRNKSTWAGQTADL